jgi:WD40 repeat protein
MLLAVGTANGDVKIYTVTSPAAPVLRDTLPTAPLDGGGVFALAFGAHGDVLAVGGYGGSAVRLYDVGAPGAPRLLSTLNGSAEQVRSLPGYTITRHAAWAA